VRDPAIKAVLFDLGETLYTYAGVPLSWKDRYRAAWHHAFRAVGVCPDSRDLDRASAGLEKFNSRLFPREREYDGVTIFTSVLGGFGLTQDQIVRIANGFFDYFRETLKPYPDSARVLDTLRRHGLRTGALTDVAYGMPARFVEMDLLACGILDRLDIWYTSVHVGYRKPHPQGFLKLCAALEVDPGEAVYVGNEEKDMAGARNAGLRAILLMREAGPARDWRQTHTIRDLSGCLDILGLDR